MRRREQSKRFIEAAREAGCDEDAGAFERAFAKIVPPKKEGDIAPEKTKASPPLKRPYRKRSTKPPDS